VITINNLKREKIKLIVLSITLVSLFIIILLIAGEKYAEGKIAATLSSGVIALVLLVTASIFLVKKFKDIKEGVPFTDERTKKLFTSASSKAYIVSLYWLLALSFAVDEFGLKLETSQALGLGILGMFVVLVICYLWVNLIGDTE
jgi:uncharacterized membrane protein YhaH (DUF805 family)